MKKRLMSLMLCMMVIQPTIRKGDCYEPPHAYEIDLIPRVRKKTEVTYNQDDRIGTSVVILGVMGIYTIACAIVACIVGFDISREYSRRKKFLKNQDPPKDIKQIAKALIEKLPVNEGGNAMFDRLCCLKNANELVGWTRNLPLDWEYEEIEKIHSCLLGLTSVTIPEQALKNLENTAIRRMGLIYGFQGTMSVNQQMKGMSDQLALVQKELEITNNRKKAIVYHSEPTLKLSISKRNNEKSPANPYPLLPSENHPNYTSTKATTQKNAGPAPEACYEYPAES